MPARLQGRPLSTLVDGPPFGLRTERRQGRLGCARGSSCARIPPTRRACERPVALRGRRIESCCQAAKPDTLTRSKNLNMSIYVPHHHSHSTRRLYACEAAIVHDG